MYSRLSKVVLFHGSKRPEVFLYQHALQNIYGRGRSLRADSIFGSKTLAFTNRFQNEKSLDNDGKVGKEVWTTLLNLVVDGELDFYGLFPLSQRVASLICLFETGHKKDAYGFSEDDIGDGAGANYGVLQHNSLGSMKRLLSMTGRKDLLKEYESTDKSKVNENIAYWMGTVEGISAQETYFNEVICKKARLELEEIGIDDGIYHDLDAGFYEKAFAFACDTITQNGTLFSNRRGPFLTTEEMERYSSFKAKYPELYYGNEWDKRFRGIDIFISGNCNLFYSSYADVKLIYNEFLSGSWRDKNKEFIKYFVQEARKRERSKYWDKVILMLLAQVRSRCSARRYWRGVEARRMLYPNGTSVIHGERVDLLHDYGIGNIEELPIKAFLNKDEEGHLIDLEELEENKPSQDLPASDFNPDK